MRVAPLGLIDGDRGKLEAILRARPRLRGLALRARIVLLAADGVSNSEIARRCGLSRPTVITGVAGTANAASSVFRT